MAERTPPTDLGCLHEVFVSVPRDGYGRCRQCGGPFGKGRDRVEHISTCKYRREWRPLRMHEYPPPGPTRTMRPVMRHGLLVAPLEVYALIEKGENS